MTTRPLELASRLRPEPWNFGALFFVNAGLLVLFFFLFGSSFVLAPGIGVDFTLPRIAGATAAGAQATHQITVKRSGLIIIEDGPADLVRLRKWLIEQKGTTGHPSLLVKADVGVETGELAEIWSAARQAGFEVLWAAEEPAATSNGGG